MCSRIISSRPCVFLTVLEEEPICSIIIPPVCWFPIYIVYSIHISSCWSFFLFCIFSIYKVMCSCIIFSISCIFLTVLEEIPSCSIIIPPICRFVIIIKDRTSIFCMNVMTCHCIYCNWCG